jgi:hypothetical protein
MTASGTSGKFNFCFAANCVKLPLQSGHCDHVDVRFNFGFGAIGKMYFYFHFRNVVQFVSNGERSSAQVQTGRL